MLDLQNGQNIMCNIWLFDIWPSIVTLTLNWHMGDMGSAYPLVEVNISAKFEENPLIGKRFIVMR